MSSRFLKTDEIAYFRKVIARYTPDPKVLESFRRSNFAVIAGPSGAGKDTLRNNLVRIFPETYLPILSTTTRQPRESERDGVDYHFKSIQQVDESLKAHEFFQADLVHSQQISCLHVNEVKKLNKEQTGLSILVVQTEADLASLKDDIKTIFLIPPDLATLRSRLESERPLNGAEVSRRMESSKIELLTALEREDYYCLVSDDLGELTQHANVYLSDSTRDTVADQRARQTIQTILNALSM